jgi:hypothetical protein
MSVNNYAAIGVAFDNRAIGQEHMDQPMFNGLGFEVQPIVNVSFTDDALVEQDLGQRHIGLVEVVIGGHVAVKPRGDSGA